MRSQSVSFFDPGKGPRGARKLKMAPRSVDTDVLVVGGGGAGFRAAVAAAAAGLRTLLVSKGPLGRCGASPMAGADFTLDGKSLRRLGFPGSDKDSPEAFFSDIVHQGFFLNNQRLLEQYVEKAPPRLEELLAWGLKITCSEERAVYTSGLWIMDVLLGKARDAGVECLENVAVLDLVLHEGRVAGAVALDVMTGEFVRIRARSAVLATGGWHKAFWPTTGMRDLSGDGMAMAYRAGAEIGNMEFVTFCCPVLLSPPHGQGSIASYIMILRAGGRLTNAAGETFLEKYDPYTVEKGTWMEWNKLFLSLAATLEVRAGLGSPNGGVYYGRGEMPWEEYDRRVTVSLKGWKYKALDLRDLAEKLRDGQTLEVGAVAEYFDGGIVIDEEFRTGVPGLFAAGECTLGPFGANRVCAAVTEMLVHGADAGDYAARFAAGNSTPRPGREVFEAIEQAALEPLNRRGNFQPAPLRRRMQEMAHRLLGPVRTETELRRLLTFLEELQADDLPRLSSASSRRVYNKEWLDTLELPNLAGLLEAAARSAFARKESRGVHYREDFPQTDNDAWLSETIVKPEEQGMGIRTRPVTGTRIRPGRGVVPYLEMLKNMMEAHSAVGGHH